MASLESYIAAWSIFGCGGLNKSIDDPWLYKIQMSLRDCINEDSEEFDIVPDILNDLCFHTSQYPTTIGFYKKRDDYERGHQVLRSWGIEHDDAMFELPWWHRE